MIFAHHSIQVSDGSHPGEARRIAGRLSAQLQLSDTRAGELSIVVMEIAKNLLAHATSGELLLLGWKSQAQRGIDVISLDKGPGIRNLQQSVVDGYSTAGTPGNGLGAISRLSSSFDVFSNTKQGTVLFARIVENNGAPSPPEAFELGEVVMPVGGESISGDGISVISEGSRTLCLAIDGLGHGIGASEAAACGMKLFEKHSDKSPQEIITLMHMAMRATRGAAVAVAEVDFLSRKLRYAGVGNISGVIIEGDKTKNLVSHNGTVGHVVGRIGELSYDFPPSAILIMHSDGLGNRWDLDSYMGLKRRHASVIAGTLYRDFRRTRDDASVLVLKQKSER